MESGLHKGILVPVDSREGDSKESWGTTCWGVKRISEDKFGLRSPPLTDILENI